MPRKKHKVFFYKANDEYGEFSNFAKYPIILKGKEWPTSEHYFQGQKFEGTAHEETIRKAKNAFSAAKLGRSLAPLPKDWDDKRVSVMFEAVQAKFTQHPELRNMLLATGDVELIEHTRNDDFWADRGDGSGQNMLGKILMDVRAELKKQDIE